MTKAESQRLRNAAANTFASMSVACAAWSHNWVLTCLCSVFAVAIAGVGARMQESRVHLEEIEKRIAQYHLLRPSTDEDTLQ